MGEISGPLYDRLRIFLCFESSGWRLAFIPDVESGEVPIDMRGT